jgi:membrane-associated phospholipid phosphatase
VKGATGGIGGPVLRERRLKARLSVVLTLFFCVPYFLLQRFPVMPVRELPLTALDRAVAFVPAWVWIYQSVYLLMTIVPWLSDSADHLRRYARGFMLQSAIGFAFFLLLPIDAPRPAVVPAGGMFGLLVSYDLTLNSFPSLHVGLAAYTALFALEASRGRLAPAPRAVVLAALGVWVCLIAFATLATKQHYAVDLPAGALLGWICHRRVWSRRFQRSTHVETIGTGSWRDPLDHVPGGVVVGAAAAGFRESTGRSGSSGASRAEADLRAGCP